MKQTKYFILKCLCILVFQKSLISIYVQHDLRIENGILEIYENNEFHQLCNDYLPQSFDNICQQLGFTQGSNRFEQVECLPYKGFIYDTIQCSSPSYHLSQCQLSLVSLSSCDPSYDCTGMICGGSLNSERLKCSAYFYDQKEQLCKCKNKEFIYGNDEQYCSKCSSNYLLYNNDCIICQEGGYKQNGECLPCDNTICATCTSSTNCLLLCNEGCKTCKIDQTCIDCKFGHYLIQNSNTCQPCDNTICATCEDDSQNCLLRCDSTCKTCKYDQSCNSCQDGQFLILQNDLDICQACDKTVCATCVNSQNNCLKLCNSDCKTCRSDQMCSSCNDGFYLQNFKCQPCNYNKCGTCVTTQNNCLQKCHNSCLTCNIKGQCLTCGDDKFLIVIKDITVCRNKVKILKQPENVEGKIIYF